jgi:N-acetylneuraminate synthase
VNEQNELFFIAEIGINHMGDLQKAKDLIRQAKLAGWHYAKFQKYTPEIFVRPEEKDVVRSTPFGKMDIWTYRNKLNFERAEYDELYEYCQTLGIKFLCSAFDAQAVEFLKPYKMDFLKIPSLGVTDKELLDATQGQDVMLSTGMCDANIIEKACKVLGDRLKYLAHCVSSYPTEPDDMNLKNIEFLRNYYGKPGRLIGYSGHEKGWVQSVNAVALGAQFIERHITLDKNQPGTDIPCSLDLSEMILLRRYVLETVRALGDTEKKILDCELNALKKLRVRDTLGGDNGI